MAHLQNVLVLAVLCVLAVALAGHDHEHDHGHDHEHNHGHDHEHEHHNHEEFSMVGQPNWVTCDFSITPRMRCHDCNTRLICKRVGGLKLDCPSQYAPYCNNGLCSPVPSVECA